MKLNTPNPFTGSLMTPELLKPKFFAKLKPESPWFKVFPNGFCPIVTPDTEVLRTPDFGSMPLLVLDHTDPLCSQEQIIMAAQMASKATGIAASTFLIDVATGKAKFTIVPDHVAGILQLTIGVRKGANK